MDEFDDFPDDLLLAALESTERQPSTTPKSKVPATRPSAASSTTPNPGNTASTASKTPTPGPSIKTKVQQPVPQTLPVQGGPPGNAPGQTPGNGPGKIVQPRPQVLPKAKASSGANIIVSPRQKGNPVLTFFKKCAWEYRPEIEPDYILGATTCALFLSLKYHRLHPEYVYKRIQALQRKYNLRVLLTLIDIPDHPDSLRELSKTALVNNLTLICCWSAAEAAHYLETYKLSEHSNFDSIKGQQAGNYMEHIFNFVTAVPGLNKTEAFSLIINCGSLKKGINAGAEELAMIDGWGDIKVKRWRDIVEEPFHPRKRGKLGVLNMEGAADIGSGSSRAGMSARVAQKMPVNRRAPAVVPRRVDTVKVVEPAKEAVESAEASKKPEEPALPGGDSGGAC